MTGAIGLPINYVSHIGDMIGSVLDGKATSGLTSLIQTFVNGMLNGQPLNAVFRSIGNILNELNHDELKV